MDTRNHKTLSISLLMVLTTVIAFSVNSASISNDIYQAAIGNKNRMPGDVVNDVKRNPLAILPFTQIEEGNKVLELGSGGGYTTELVSWVVGDSGHIYAHFLYNTDRLKDKRLDNVTALREHSLDELAEVLHENKIE